MMASACILSSIIPNNVNANEPDENKAVDVEIYPKPVAVNYLSQDGMSLSGKVNLVIHGEHDQATIDHLTELLKENQINYALSDEIIEGEAVILLSTDKNDINEIPDASSDTLNNAGGYLLYSSNDQNDKGEVIIVGADEDGAFNAVMSLKQMLDQDVEGKFAEVNISDYPNIKQRGVIEGFYGYPWSFEDRAEMIEDMSEYKMNTFIYAPKDDPYHRDRWRELYPKEEAEQLQQLVEVSKKENVDFVWMIHPGATYVYGPEGDYANSSDFDTMIAKFEQLYSLGVRQFGVSYDDIPVNDSQLVNEANKHAAVLARVKEWIDEKGDVKPLVTVGTEYRGTTTKGYLTPIMQVVDKEDIVLWTGKDIFSDIKREYFEGPKQATGIDKNLSVWWNYPVNDMHLDRLFLQQFGENVDKNLDNVDAFVMNPMVETEASKVAVYTGADYAWNTASFDSDWSWKRGIKELIPDASDAFTRFADNISSGNGSNSYTESSYLREKIDNLTKELNSGTVTKETLEAMKSEFETIINDVEVLKKTSNTALLEECDQFLKAYEALGKAGFAATEALLYNSDGQYDKCIISLFESKDKLSEMETYQRIALDQYGNTVKSSVYVGSGLLKPLVEKMISGFDEVEMASKASSVISSQDDLISGNVFFDSMVYNTDSLNIQSLENGQYVGLRLSTPQRLSEVRLSGIISGQISFEYSLNGIEWTEGNCTIENGSAVRTEITDAMYVRFINKQDIPVVIDSSSNKLSASIYQSLDFTPVASCDFGWPHNANNKKLAEIAFDEKFNDMAEFQDTVGTNKSIIVDLGKNIPLHDVKVYIKQNTFFKADTKIQFRISSDSQEWITITETTGSDVQQEEITVGGMPLYSLNFDAEGNKCRYLQILIPEQVAWPSYLNIAEIEINKSVDIGEAIDDEPSLIDTALSGGEEKYLYDDAEHTFYVPDSVEIGDTLVYKLWKHSMMENLVITQDPNYISNAKVEIKKENGNTVTWEEVGTLSEAKNQFAVHGNVLEVKLTFDGQVVPHIGEIKGTPYIVKADYTKVDEMITKANALDKNMYKDFSGVEEALANVVYDLDITHQAEVDAMAKAIEDAISALEYKDADYSEVNDAVTKANGLNKDLYKDFSGVEEALANVVYDLDITHQEEVNAMAKAIEDAINALEYKDADYSKVNDAVTKANGLNKDLYKDFSAVEKALEAVNPDLDITQQEEVDAMAKAIEDAIRALEYKDADYSAVEKAKEKVPTDLSIYTEESVKALNDALAGVVEGKNITEQEEVDAMAKAIENAINGLVKKDTGKPEDPSKPSEPTTPTDPDSDKPETPSTSDTTNIIVYVGSLLIAMVTMVMLVVRRREVH